MSSCRLKLSHTYPPPPLSFTLPQRTGGKRPDEVLRGSSRPATEHVDQLHGVGGDDGADACQQRDGVAPGDVLLRQRGVVRVRLLGVGSDVSPCFAFGEGGACAAYALVDCLKTIERASPDHGGSVCSFLQNVGFASEP